MTFKLLILVLIPSLVSAQSISSFEAKDEMSTVIILEANDSCVYRIGVEGLGNDHIKKTSYNGKELASRKLNDTKNKVRLRGAYIRNNLIHTLIADDSNDSTKLRLLILDMDLNPVEEKLIYSGSLIGKGWKAKTFFSANKNGFVMIRDYLWNKRVWLNTFIYNFEKDSIYVSEIKFKASSKQKVIDIDFNEDLQVSLITSDFYFLGSHKSRDLKKINTYLIHAGFNQALTHLKLNQDKDYSNRSFNSFFIEDKLSIASLKFNERSNIFEGYYVRTYIRNNSSLEVNTEELYNFKDYAYRDEWQVSRNEVIKQFERDKDRKNSKNSHLANLHIGEVIVQDDGDLLLIIREAEHDGDYFTDLQVVNIDTENNQVIWWNRLLNAPRKEKSYSFRRSIQNPLWSSLNISSELISIKPILKSNELILLYGSFNSLYKRNELIQDKEIKQGEVFGNNAFATKMLGRTNIDLSSGEFNSDLVIDEEYGHKNFLSFSFMNTEGLHHLKNQVYLPLETPSKWKSVIVSFPLTN